MWDGVEGGSVAVAALAAPLQSPSGLMPPLTNAVSFMDFTWSCMFQAIKAADLPKGHVLSGDGAILAIGGQMILRPWWCSKQCHAA